MEVWSGVEEEDLGAGGSKLLFDAAAYDIEAEGTRKVLELEEKFGKVNDDLEEE